MMRSLPYLRVSKAGAQKEINAQVVRGHRIRHRLLNAPSEEGLEQAQRERSDWDYDNLHLLQTLFSDAAVANEYSGFPGAIVSPGSALWERIREFAEEIGYAINKLESVRERLDLYPPKPGLFVRFLRRLGNFFVRIKSITIQGWGVSFKDK